MALETLKQVWTAWYDWREGMWSEDGALALSLHVSIEESGRIIVGATLAVALGCTLGCAFAFPLDGPGSSGRSMSENQEHWYNRQAIEQLAQHIPFERDSASKAEQIEMLRGLVIRHGRGMDPDLFGFDARNELIRLGLWNRIGPERPAGQEGEPP